MLVAIAVGGAFGATLRYLVSLYFGSLLGVIFPWGTLAINLSGSFFTGMLHSFTLAGTLSSQSRSFAAIGLLGAFTTFSTFTLESLIMLREGDVFRAIVYMVVSTALGVLGAFIGLGTGQMLGGGGM
ncbi:MAG: fluoride efflux transporter CrcB [Firmicutes bacterium]|nr:fluoride efflux transporter CrcB [Bacillota bacterium]